MKTDPPTTRERVERLFPLDGPHTDDDVRDAAAVLDHLAHYLASATLPHRALTTVEQPSTVATVTNRLCSAAAALVQVTTQLGRRMLDLGDHERAYDDGMGKPIQGVPADRVPSVRASWAMEELHNASQHIAAASCSLQASHSQSDRIGIRPEPEA